MEISEVEFGKLLKESKPFFVSENFSTVGDLFILKNGQFLFKGKEFWAEDKSLLLDSVLELLEFDPELEKIIPTRQLVSNEFDYPQMDNPEESYYEIEMNEEEITNKEKLINMLSSASGVDAMYLDFTVNSFEIIENEIMNDFAIDRYSLLTLFIGYVSEVVVRNVGGCHLSIEDDGGNFYMRNNDKKLSNIGLHSSTWTVEAEYCVSISMVYRSVLEDLEKKQVGS